MIQSTGENSHRPIESKERVRHPFGTRRELWEKITRSLGKLIHRYRALDRIRPGLARI